MKQKSFQLTTFSLHIIAMLCMLVDHMWATVTSGNNWMNCVGRIAFPIFAFLIANGYFYTHDRKKYFYRLLFFAVLSEIPFNLINSSTLFNPFHQNVLWTFLISLLTMMWIDHTRLKNRKPVSVLKTAAIVLLSFLISTICCVDYLGFGVLTVLLFYFFHGHRWYDFLGQFSGLFVINWILIKGMDLPLFTIREYTFYFPTQGFALLALLPIWLYRGKQGPHNKKIQFFFYSFYPLHMLLLFILTLL